MGQNERFKSGIRLLCGFERTSKVSIQHEGLFERLLRNYEVAEIQICETALELKNGVLKEFFVRFESLLNQIFNHLVLAIGKKSVGLLDQFLKVQTSAGSNFALDIDISWSFGFRFCKSVWHVRASHICRLGSIQIIDLFIFLCSCGRKS